MIELNSGIGNYIRSNGIIFPFINYPVRQKKYLLRIAVTITHTSEQMKELVENLTKWKEKHGTN